MRQGILARDALMLLLDVFYGFVGGEATVLGGFAQIVVGFRCVGLGAFAFAVHLRKAFVDECEDGAGQFAVLRNRLVIA